MTNSEIIGSPGNVQFS